MLEATWFKFSLLWCSSYGPEKLSDFPNLQEPQESERKNQNYIQNPKWRGIFTHFFFFKLFSWGMISTKRCFSFLRFYSHIHICSLEIQKKENQVLDFRSWLFLLFLIFSLEDKLDYSFYIIDKEIEVKRKEVRSTISHFSFWLRKGFGSKCLF